MQTQNTLLSTRGIVCSEPILCALKVSVVYMSHSLVPPSSAHLERNVTRTATTFYGVPRAFLERYVLAGGRPHARGPRFASCSGA